MTNLTRFFFLAIKICPGVCVAEGISGYCDAIFKVSGLCKDNQKCCVPSNLFDGQDPPAEFQINANPESVEPVTTPLPIPQSIPQLPEDFSQPGFRPNPNQPLPRPPSFNEVPQELVCKGTCVTGFFAFLCDAIDDQALCPKGGRCCITKKPTTNGPPNRRPGDDNQIPDFAHTRPVPTRPVPTRPVTTTTTTTTTPRPTTPAKPPVPQIPPCPGVCIPFLMAAICVSPAKVLPQTTCETGTLCCDLRRLIKEGIGYIGGQGGPPEGPRPPPPRPGQQQRPPPPHLRPPNRPNPILSGPLGALLPFLPAFSLPPNAITPPPTPLPPRVDSPRPTSVRVSSPSPSTTRYTTPTPFTTTTTVATTTPEAKPECPGTCIAPFLSFTCFGKFQ